MNVREHTLNALIQIDKNNAYSNLVVKEYLQKYTFTAEDKALFTNIVYGVITHKKYLLYVLQRHVKRPHKQVFWLKNLLLISAYQLLFLDIPEYAVTSEAVNIAKKKGGSTKGNFINGVLRSIIRDRESLEIPKDDLVNYLSIKYSLQEWMVREFKDSVNENEELEQLCASFNETLPLTLRVNTLCITAEKLVEILRELGIKSSRSALCKDGVVLEAKVPIDRIKKILDEGLCVIQDQGSMMVAEVVDPKPTDLILDMCAAPGGKSTHLAQLMNNHGTIISCDIHQHKIQLIEDLSKRLGIKNIQAKLLDGTVAINHFEYEMFDKILLDAPCSGLGVIVGKPDIKWSKKQEDVEEIAKIQWELLLNASRLLKNEGVLVYSTCTLTKRENEDMIKRFTNEHRDITLEEELKLYPHKDKCHGFYIAKLIKKR